MKKKRVLLLWWEIDHRPEFLQPFIDMSDKLEFIQLNYKNRKERTTHSSPYRMIYWHDYKNAQAVLKDIAPEVIIGVTESIFSAALINAAKKATIPFYGLQHGISSENISTLIVDPRTFSLGLLTSYLRSTLFFLRSFSIFNVRKFCSAVYFYWIYPRFIIQKILTEHNFPWLVPDYYICFSEYSAAHYKEMYRMNNDKIKYIGILWFDKLFQRIGMPSHEKTMPGQKYYLLIDTSFDGYQKTVTEQQVNRCYQTLSHYCEQQGAKLYIKLHPWNYNKTNLLEHSNIEYVRMLDDEALHSMIAGCEGCFGFYSTLILPILAIKPVIQIDHDGIYLKTAKEKGLTALIDFYSFTEKDIQFPKAGIREAQKKDLDYLLYKTDGHATERLKEILLNA